MFLFRSPRMALRSRLVLTVLVACSIISATHAGLCPYTRWSVPMHTRWPVPIHTRWPVPLLHRRIPDQAEVFPSLISSTQESWIWNLEDFWLILEEFSNSPTLESQSQIRSQKRRMLSHEVLISYVHKMNACVTLMCCVDECLCDPEEDVAAQVCGDGVLYSSACFAACHGAVGVVEGPCPSGPPPSSHAPGALASHEREEGGRG